MTPADWFDQKIFHFNPCNKILIVRKILKNLYVFDWFTCSNKLFSVTDGLFCFMTSSIESSALERVELIEKTFISIPSSNYWQSEKSKCFLWLRFLSAHKRSLLCNNKLNFLLQGLNLKILTSTGGFARKTVNIDTRVKVFIVQNCNFSYFLSLDNQN